jgi:hypothetical protein
MQHPSPRTQVDYKCSSHTHYKSAWTRSRRKSSAHMCNPPESPLPKWRYRAKDNFAWWPWRPSRHLEISATKVHYVGPPLSGNPTSHNQPGCNRSATAGSLEPPKQPRGMDPARFPRCPLGYLELICDPEFGTFTRHPTDEIKVIKPGPGIPGFVPALVRCQRGRESELELRALTLASRAHFR